MPQTVGPAFTEAITILLTEIEAGEGLSLSAAGRMFPAFRGHGTVGPSTTFRWATRGAKAHNGALVKLEAARVGGRWLTSRPAVIRFIAALTEVPTPTGTPAVRTPAQRQRAIEAAGRRLEAKGA